MNEADIIEGAREVLTEESSWCQGELITAEGTAYCAIGALWTVGCKHPRAYWAAREMLGQHLPNEFQRHADGAPDPIAVFNDAATTTHADILALFDKTLADLGAL